MHRRNLLADVWLYTKIPIVTTFTLIEIHLILIPTFMTWCQSEYFMRIKKMYGGL